MATAVVCEDDGVVRSAVTAICESAGLQVVAETEIGMIAVDLVERFDVDVLILDQSLPDVAGEHILRTLRERQARVEVVVFGEYASDPHELIDLGARAVVEKPDLHRLAQVIEGVVLSLADAAQRAHEERRTTRRMVEGAVDVPRSDAGIASAEDLLRSAPHTEIGDSVLVLAHTAAGASAPGAGLGALLRSAVRAQDIVHDRPHRDGYVAVLRGGDEQTPEAVWRRLVALAAEAGIPDELHGAWSQIDGLGLLAAVERAEDALLAPRGDKPGLQPA